MFWTWALLAAAAIPLQASVHASRAGTAATRRGDHHRAHRLHTQATRLSATAAIICGCSLFLSILRLVTL